MNEVKHEDGRNKVNMLRDICSERGRGFNLKTHSSKILKGKQNEEQRNMKVLLGTTNPSKVKRFFKIY